MANRDLLPGLAFTIACDVGLAVGLATHDLPKHGTLIWIADPTYEEEPTLEDIKRIRSWRLPVLFPLSAAIKKKLVTVIGHMEIPIELRKFPVMRGGGGVLNWMAVTLDSGEQKVLGPTDDMSLPIWRIVNDTALKRLIVSEKIHRAENS